MLSGGVAEDEKRGEIKWLEDENIGGRVWLPLSLEALELEDDCAEVFGDWAVLSLGVELRL